MSASTSATTPATPAVTTKPPMPSDRVGRTFVYVAIVEAFTWAGLLIGMLLKHVVDLTELGVTIFGPIHGVAVMVYVALGLVAAIRFKWSLKLLILTWACAIPPFTTIPMERWLRRKDRLSVPDENPAVTA